MGSREALRGLLLALEPIAHNHRPATPPDFSDEDPENWTTGTPATHIIAFPPRGPMVDAVIDAILASDWLRDTLAAERERCAEMADVMKAGWASDFSAPIEKVEAATTALHNLAVAIRNLEPEASDDRG